MNKDEKVIYEHEIENYVQKTQLPDYFENLTKQLVINQPENPYKFLIEYLERRQRQRLILVTGGTTETREDICKQISTQLNYKFHKVDGNDLNKDLNAINDTIMNEQASKLIKYTSENEKHYTGMIVSGYPNNYQQAIHIQKNKQLFERVFILKQNKEDLKNQYSEIYNYDQQKVESAILRDEINQRDLSEAFGQYPDYFEINDKNTDVRKVVNNMIQILKNQDQKVAPLRSPRIIIFSPPFLRKKINSLVAQIAQQFGFYRINLEDVIQKHIDQQTEVGKYLYRSQKLKNTIPIEILVSLIKTETQRPVAQKKGWVLQGFGKNEEEINILKNIKLHPNLVIGLNEKEEKLLKIYQNLKIDPQFNIKYEADLEVNADLYKRLVEDKEFNQDLQQQTIKQHNQNLVQAQDAFQKQFQKYTLNDESDEKLIQIISQHLENPFFYGEI
ncbi:P-loop containing nucleoside triphosphate hydrolase [Pseudocohnilembus persalinus]|uniref:p-loop containing nucleoside triphosphate hydrolase n=1 Tax=Pseudocohnilembus persalinus TaxID=266149 RepID=A0A0V0R8T9_PSEPJ|nr:P-loop containing nucleoside triphosphate hydrolase [Pseudocohnilembus persalinus]|eukprot:KRX10916.1 P-loop containing nucleoside triphosphate hydrolase [Pseudocohnilembus persalinus]